MTCDCKEPGEGGNVCHSNDVCEYQLFGGFDGPVFCGEDEIKEFDKNNPRGYERGGEQR